MYAITGITGHVGGATAGALASAGEPVRAVLRDPARLTGTTALQGVPAEVMVADYTDPTALTTALTGCRGVFVMLPTLASGSDAEHRDLAGTIANAVATSGVPYVVALSSLGAQHSDGTGPIRWLHHLEQQLAGTGAVVTVIRSPHFQEKLADVLPAAQAQGVFPVLGDPDRVFPMVATTDIGAVAADLLRSAPSSSGIVELDAPRYSEREVARALGEALGRSLDVVAVPREQWSAALVADGVPAVLAAELAELADADDRGLLVGTGSPARSCRTPIRTTIAGLLGGAGQSGS